MNISLNIHRNPDDILWTYTDKMDTFAKFTQYMPEQLVASVPEPIQPSLQPPVPEPVKQPVTEPIQQSLQQPVKKSKQVAKKPSQDTSLNPPNKKPTKLTPIDIIITMTENNLINLDYIKQNLKDFISKKEFQKAFGIKKTSEIMQALTDNKFNKSMALFISFLFNVIIIYMNKEVSYYPDAQDIQKITV
jgi:hypothetical protein